MKRVFIITLALIVPLLASACNTVAGAGQDVSAGGNAVAHSAEKNKDYSADLPAPV